MVDRLTDTADDASRRLPQRHVAPGTPPCPRGTASPATRKRRRTALPPAPRNTHQRGDHTAVHGRLPYYAHAATPGSGLWHPPNYVTSRCDRRCSRIHAAPEPPHMQPRSTPPLRYNTNTTTQGGVARPHAPTRHSNPVTPAFQSHTPQPSPPPHSTPTAPHRNLPLMILYPPYLDPPTPHDPTPNRQPLATSSQLPVDLDRLLVRVSPCGWRRLAARGPSLVVMQAGHEQQVGRDEHGLRGPARGCRCRPVGGVVVAVVREVGGEVVVVVRHGVGRAGAHEDEVPLGELLRGHAQRGLEGAGRFRGGAGVVMASGERQGNRTLASCCLTFQDRPLQFSCAGLSLHHRWCACNTKSLSRPSHLATPHAR